MNFSLQTLRFSKYNGADVNAKGGEYGTALQAECFRRHDDIFQILIANVSNVKAQGRKHSNALKAATKKEA